MPKAVSCKLDGERLNYLESMADRDGWDRSRVIRESLDVTQDLGFDIEEDVDDELSNQIGELERELAEKEQKIEHLETRIDDLQSHNTQLKRMVGEARIREEGFEELAEAIQRRDNDLDSMLTEFEKELKRHDQHLRGSIEALDEWTKAMRRLHSVVSHMADDVGDIKKDAVLVAEEVRTLKKREEATLRDWWRGRVSFRQWLR